MAKSLSRQKEVTIEYIEDEEQVEEVIKVQKAGLGQWKKLTDTIKNIMEALPEILDQAGIENQEQFWKNAQMQDLAPLIPDALGIITDEIINLISIGTGFDSDFVEENVGVDEAVDLILAIIEVNNFKKAAETGKKLMDLFQSK